MAYKQHHAWFLLPAWGHITSGHATIARMLQLNPSLVVTVLHHAEILKRAEADIAQYTDVPRNRIKIVGVGNPNIIKIHGAKYMMPAFKETCDGWISTLTASTSADATWPKPTAIIQDRYGTNMILAQAKSIVGPSSDTKDGGWADYKETVAKYMSDEGLRKGRVESEVLDAIATVKNGTDAFNGTIYQVPGIGPMYDYELEASNGPTPQGLAPMLCSIVDQAKNTDGTILASSVTIEGDIIKALGDIIKTYAVGISVAARAWDAWEKGLDVKDDVVRSFLNKFGKDEVLFISFGSHFFPTTDPRHVTCLLDTLQSLSYPFILALGGRMAADIMPASKIESINSSDKGLIHNEWVDQQAILQHDSVGWFLTHGGWNSISESLVIGKPMMVWPLAQGDQSTNAALLSMREKGKLGFEFLEIRQGAAKQKTMRTGLPIKGTLESVEAEFRDVLAKANGPEGAQIKENVKAFPAELREERDGRADDVLRELASI